jgi:hypothetical protein
MEGAGGKQHPIARRTPRKRMEAAGRTIRQDFFRRTAGYRSVLGSNLTFVARALGSDLVHGRLIILGYLVTARVSQEKKRSPECFGRGLWHHF